jgi:MshEN domain
LIERMSAAAEDIARDDQSGDALAEKWSLRYVKASAVCVDPRALALLALADCKRLRAIPLATGSGGSLVAVCSPSEERFAAIRELTGEQTEFALVSEGTLDALLGSRMFADSAAKSPAGAPAEPQQATSEEPAEETDVDTATGPAAAARRRRDADDEVEPEPAAVEEPATVEDAAPPPSPEPPETPVPREPTAGGPAEVPAGGESASVDNIVSAVLNALKHRVGSTPDTPGVEIAEPRAEATPLPGSTAELLEHLDATVETWASLRAALASSHAEFEETKRALREVKEQLSVAHADNDQYRKRVRMLEGELAESREAVTQARAHLRDAADLLEADSTQLQESTELL